MTTVKTSFSLPKKVKKLIELLAKKYNISQTAAVSVAVTEKAEKEEIDIEEEI